MELIPLIVVAILLFIFFNKSPKAIGRRGESAIANTLDFASFFGKSGKTLRNLYVPTANGKTTEIDIIYIMVKGIFVIESKNYTGYIFGSDNQRNWTVTLYKGRFRRLEKHKFYNPIWQNNTHMKALREYLGEDIKMMSLIVFSDRCELKSINYAQDSVIVCKRNHLNRALSNFWNTTPDLLSEEKIEELYARLFALTNPDEVTKQAHVESIKNDYSNANICPWCGGKLVLRTARKGSNAGKQFYGCSNYPRCKYILDMKYRDKLS